MLKLRPVGRGNWRPLVLELKDGDVLTLPTQPLPGVAVSAEERMAAVRRWSFRDGAGRAWRVSEVVL